MPNLPTKECCKKCKGGLHPYLGVPFKCSNALCVCHDLEYKQSTANTPMNLPEPEKECTDHFIKGHHKGINTLDCIHQPTPLSWEEIKEKYSQSGWFDNIRDIKELDKEIANLLLQRDTELRAKIEEMKKPRHIEDCTIKHFQADKCGWCIIRMGDYGKAFDEGLKLLPSPGSVEPTEDSPAEAKTQNQLLKEE